MRLKAAATIPSAFAAGLAGVLAISVIERGRTPVSELVLYAGAVVVPFFICVIGVDRKRRNRDYDWFSPAAKADIRRVWIRWAAYMIGSMVAYGVR